MEPAARFFFFSLFFSAALCAAHKLRESSRPEWDLRNEGRCLMDVLLPLVVLNTGTVSFLRTFLSKPSDTQTDSDLPTLLHVHGENFLLNSGSKLSSC